MPETSGWISTSVAYDDAVEAGYRATLAALDKLIKPVTALRRRPSLREQAAAGAVLTPFMASTHAAAE